MVVRVRHSLDVGVRSHECGLAIDDHIAEVRAGCIHLRSVRARINLILSIGTALNRTRAYARSRQTQAESRVPGIRLEKDRELPALGLDSPWVSRLLKSLGHEVI